ncbi:hypothetical protein VDG1235_1862 [Verrucomicrobiia bacterium DG1235]|nr:hypothetical protein VDG1235_1862 [Verrucomicrobiae bacterium DG1235]
MEDWQAEQARLSVEWLLDAACSHVGEDFPAKMPVREKVVLPLLELAGLEQVEEHFAESGGMTEVVRVVARRKGRSLNMEKSYVFWVGRFVKWWRKQSCGSVQVSCREQAGEELERAISGFLDFLTVEEGVAKAT